MMRGAAARLDDREPQPLVSAAEVSAYLRTHQQAPDEMQMLIVDGTMAYCRWPNGSVRWQTAQSLRDRGYTVPARGVLQTRSA